MAASKMYRSLNFSPVTCVSTQDEVRVQEKTRQKSTLEAVNISVNLLNEMLVHFSLETSSPADQELIRVCCLHLKSVIVLN